MKKLVDSRPRVFVVDDDLDIAKMMAVILQINLFDAIPYSDPVAALQAARLMPPDYLITDIVMPGMNGIDLAIALKQEVARCKVLLFSGQAEASKLVKEANDAGGYSFSLLQKPVQPNKLIAALLEL